MYPFGNISIGKTADTVLFDGVGIGTTQPTGISTDLNVQVGSGTTEVHVDVGGNVGIATTNPTDPLTVLGAANISGVITASSFSGIGSFTD